MIEMKARNIMERYNNMNSHYEVFCQAAQRHGMDYEEDQSIELELPIFYKIEEYPAD